MNSDYLTSVFNLLSNIFGCIETICTVLGFAAGLAIFVGSLAGITQAMCRFGLALCAKRIAIIAGSDDFNDIKRDLVNSGLIKAKNIQHVTNKHLNEVQSALLVIIV